MRFVVRADGPYLVRANGQEVYLDGTIALVNPDGSLTLRILPRDVTVEAPIDPGSHYDMTDVPRLVVAVVRGNLTIAQIAAVRPGVAVVVQTFMTNNGLTAGSVQ